MQTGLFLGSADSDRFSIAEGFASRGDAVRAAAKASGQGVGGTVFTGVAQEIDPGAFALGGTVIDTASMYMYEAVGEPARDWPGPVPQEQMQDLDRRIGAALNAWLVDHDRVKRLFTVVNVERHEITQEMLEASE